MEVLKPSHISTIEAEATSLSSSASGKIEMGPSDQKSYPLTTQANAAAHLENEKDLSDLGSGDAHIMEEAKKRAKERQMLKREQRSHGETSGHAYLTDLESSLLQKYAVKNHDPSHSDSQTGLELTRPTTDGSGEAQKELLERRMRERSPVMHTIRPPWFTEEKSISKMVRSQNTSDSKKWDFQRTCNQIDFPSYTVEEMRSARPKTITEARHKKCTWMPNLAPEVIAESQVGRRSTSNKISHNGSIESNRFSTKSPRRANDVNLPAHSKVPAPYAMD
ncbi:unnamed protein product [Hydatigera taeniaeformis]|uniref:PEHE domain-containing protein n=1 Tax=Hydatigena taeniaeformis TaxID=6205 RepID=A0A0R3WML0_HYDTA|nr:unnamed protein product [Hydatigera taeniaeformis]